MFEYYYNTVPGKGLCRNNLVYTSKIDRQNNLFSVHYTVDQTYHKNECLPQAVLNEKWRREFKYTLEAPHTLDVKELDSIKRRIIFNIQGDDFWQLANCNWRNFDKILPDWQEQMLTILQDYRNKGIWKYSLHPSSFFIVDGQLRTVNHFFCYSDDEPEVSIESVLDHISKDRQEKLFEYLDTHGIDPSKTFSFKFYGGVVLDNFNNDYPKEFIEAAKKIYLA